MVDNQHTDATLTVERKFASFEEILMKILFSITSGIYEIFT